MIKCLKCGKRMFVDRQYNSVSHIEIFCLCCGSRRFFHPPEESTEGKWILQKEILMSKRTIVTL